MKTLTQFKSELVEKHLTTAELKKREEIAKAMHRQNPEMDMAKKMAIATAQAKKVAEGTETCPRCNVEPCECNDSHGFVAEELLGDDIEQTKD